MPEIVPDSIFSMNNKDNDKKAHEYFYRRLTMFDYSIRYSVTPYGDDDNIDSLKALYDIWTFGEQIDNVQQQLDEQQQQQTRETEIELIRRALERNGI